MSSDVVRDMVPRRRSRLGRLVGRAVFRVLRWRLAGDLPNRSKFVVVVAPHTSNWDFVVGMAAALQLDVDARWIGKHTIFRPPFGSFMRGLGGIPVDRSAPSGLVDQIVTQIDNSEAFVLGLAPEGTRRSVEHWKSGFYRIAVGADIPIVCAYFDYPTRTVGIGPEIWPTGNYDSDLAGIRRFYQPFRGRESGPDRPPAPKS